MLAFLDLETTGLDPKKGSILELALVLTDDDLKPIAEPFSEVVRPMHLRGYEVMDDYVRNMHRESGLLALLYADHHGPGAEVVERPSIRRCGEVEAAAIEWLLSTVERAAPAVLGGPHKTLKTTPLAGNSIHFDRSWLAEHMPDLERLFLHRNVDVSTLNESARRWRPELYDARPGAGGSPKHRALDDVYASIDAARHYRTNLFGVSEL